LILRKIIKIVATRCPILWLKCTKFDFSWGSTPDPAGGAHSAPPAPNCMHLRGPTSKGREGNGREGKGRGKKKKRKKGRTGRGRKEREGRLRHGFGGMDAPVIICHAVLYIVAVSDTANVFSVFDQSFS